MFTERRQPQFQALPSSPVWIHAASGEVEYAKPVIRLLKQHYPQLPILLTYFSPSAKKLIQKQEGIDLAMPLPWDTKKSVQAFLDFYKPRAALFARTDVWPEYASQLKQRKIPSLLFSATLAENSSKRRFFSGSLARFALRQLSAIQCVSAQDQQNFSQLKIHVPMDVCGDTRFDQVFHRLLVEKRPLKKPTMPAREKILVCGSTWPADELLVFDCLAITHKDRPKVILAPHETDEAHLTEIEVELAKRELKSIRLSNCESWDQEDILLVDQVGSLQEIYNWGSVALVGGSFKDKVHSVMEPLGAGLPVIVGPYYQNNREAIQYLEQALGDGLCFVNTITFAKELRNLVEKFSQLELDHGAIQKAVSRSTGASEKVLIWLKQSLNK